MIQFNNNLDCTADEHISKIKTFAYFFNFSPMASKCLYYQSWHLTTSEIKWIKSLKIFKSKNLVNEVEAFLMHF